ncbi:MAG: transglutaminase family protein [Ruminococcus sp.]|nr:transglutaminase family protein [Ruminococcus sp.]MCD7812263.1 transglutaminase family protein [Ruminococcus sp.]
MKKVNYTFSTKLTFDNYVYNHSFALRCIPPECEVQHIISCQLDISPFVPTMQTVDAFGNNVTSGYLKSEHRFLDFEISGSAEINSAAERTDFMPCYAYQSKYTKPDDALRSFYAEHKPFCLSEDVFERTAYFSGKLSEVMKYEKNVTDTKTTAAEAFALKKGVCQDFTHIMLSILRMDCIPCRYIAGLACCDGETHSWLELWNGKSWIGYDPTNNCPVSDDYLILSQGRDFEDCAIDRGVMFGAYTKQLQLISSYLTLA